MPHLFQDPEWRSLMTAISFATDADDTARLAAAKVLEANGEPLRAAYIRSCCQSPSAGHQSTLAHCLPQEEAIVPCSGWIPQSELLCYWHRGFITRVHGPLVTIRTELTRLMLREPLYQSPNGPLAVSISDRSAYRTGEQDTETLWAWGNVAECDAQTISDLPGPMLPSEVFDLLPWPPIFDNPHAAALALSSALLAEAHDRLLEQCQIDEDQPQMTIFNPMTV